METMGIVNLTKELKRLNPRIRIRFTQDGYPGAIITSHFFKFFQSRMKLPEGYYLSEKNGITNKHNTTTGVYEFFELMTEREYRKMMA